MKGQDFPPRPLGTLTGNNVRASTALRNNAPRHQQVAAKQCLEFLWIPTNSPFVIRLANFSHVFVRGGNLPTRDPNGMPILPWR